MAERNETLTTNKSVDEALGAGTRTLESLGLKVNKTGPSALHAHAGSKFMVYWIGLILPNSSMPVKVDYTVTDSGGTRTVQMHTKSSVFLSFYLWKYKARANQVAEALSQGVASQLR